MTTKVNFKNSVIALAIGLVMTSCGGRGGNQQSGAATSETQTETAKSGGKSEAELRAHYDEVARPTVEFIEDWMLPTEGILESAKEQGTNVWEFTVGGLNRAQYDNYLKTLETKAQKVASATNDADFVYNDVQISTFLGTSFKEDGGGERSWGYERSSIKIYIVKK